MNELEAPSRGIDKDMAKDFLAYLDPNATRFTFQFIGDGSGGRAEIFHGTLDEAWSRVRTLNTPERQIGVFVTVNETDFRGRASENVVRVRALFVDADGGEQVEQCRETFEEYGITPSMVVKTGRGAHYYFLVDNVPCDQFRDWQEKLIHRLGTDPAIKDLSRVMRLPGTLHLKSPTDPRLVQLVSAGTSVDRLTQSELSKKLGLSATVAGSSPATAPRTNENWYNAANFAEADRQRLHALFGHLTGKLSDGLETDLDEVRSAVAAIPPTAISTEGDWLRLARGLAHEAAIHKEQAQQLWEVLDTASRGAPGYDHEDNRRRWDRYVAEAFNNENPITIATVFDLAHKHGWQGWSPPPATYLDAPEAGVQPASFRFSFGRIRHRQWLYGIDLLRGDITVLASPGGAGKTSLAIGMSISIATGKDFLGEKISGAGLTALYINAEDSGDEMRRRIFAFCLQHGVAELDLTRLLIAGTDDPQVRGLSFLQAIEKNSVLDLGGLKRLEGLLAVLRPDLLVLDPLIALCGGGNTNENSVMSLLFRELKGLAIKHNCAILIIHHNRKGGDPGNAEAISGAAAITNLARRAIMPVPMSIDEAKQLGVLPSERLRYFKVVDAKSNLAPRSADSPWYELYSVELPNPEPPLYPHGDNVQAVARVALPAQPSGVASPEDLEIERAIFNLVDRGKEIDGEFYPYSPSLAGSKNERALIPDAMAAVTSATSPRLWLPGDLKAVINTAINKMLADGRLVDETLGDLMPKPGRFRSRARGLKAVPI